MGDPVVVRCDDAAVALLAVADEPLELGLVVGLPVRAEGSHLATGVGLTQAISTRRGVGGGGAPTGLVVDDVVRSGEVRFAIPVVQQILMRPGLNFSSRNSGAEIGRR